MNELKKYKWKVCVSCMTYNHAPYILNALNGFCMQETDFPFVCTIVDDASTDGEPEDIRRYLEENFCLNDISVVKNEETDDFVMTFAQHKTNKNCYFAVLLLKYNHYQKKKPKLPYLKEWRDNAKYIAICEGDDYWIDSRKLQTQVEFLCSHEDYTLCFHNALIRDEIKKQDEKAFALLEEREYTGEEILRDWTIPTASVIYPSWIILTELYKDVWSNKNFYYGDTLLFLTCAHYGKIFCIPNFFSVYVVHYGSFTHTFHHSYSNKERLYIHIRELTKVFGPRYKSICKMKCRKLCVQEMVYSLHHFEPAYFFKFFYRWIQAL